MPKLIEVTMFLVIKKIICLEAHEEFNDIFQLTAIKLFVLYF